MAQRRILSAFCFLSLLWLGSCADYGNSLPDPKKSALTEFSPGQNVAENPFPAGFESPNEGAFSEAKMLVNIGVNVIHPQVKDFALRAELLNLELNRECRSLEGSRETFSIAVADAWRQAMLSFHVVNAVPVGPLLDNARALLDGIYSWPLQSVCGIDLLTIRHANGTPLPANIPLNVKGLGAIEYLLFETTLTSRCNPNAQPQAAAWSQKPEREKRLDRCRMARFLSQDLVARAKNLEASWDPRRGNFSKTLIDGSRYASVKDAVNAVSDSLFSLEKLKDDRIGKPLGRHRDCLSGARKCPEMAEHSWSGLALRAAQAELRGFESVFMGGILEDGFGFDDFLRNLGRGDVAEALKTGLAASLTSVDVLSQGESLQALVARMDPDACAASTSTDRREPICSFHAELRTLSTTLKIEVLAALSLRAPASHQGDND